MKPVHEVIESELASGEELLWSGRPRPGFVLRGSDLLLIPFSLLWCGFAIFWEWSVMHHPGTPSLFVVWGIPFICVGVYLVAGRFFVERVQRRHTFYAVTNERVLIVSGVLARRVRSLRLVALAELSLTQRRRGEGTIAFGGDAPYRPMMAGLAAWPGALAQAGPRFDRIDKARSVFELIRQAQRDAGSRP